MQILAVPYALLLVATAGLCQLLPAAARPYLLALASLGFYALLSGWQALLILALLGLVFGLAQATLRFRQQPALRRGLPALGIALCVAVLAYFKYAGFLAGSALDVWGWLHPGAAAAATSPKLPSALSVVAPLGISFFTFEFVHFLADVYRGQIALLPPTASPPQRRKELAQFAAFGLFFPTLLAGPIKRYQSFQPTGRLGGEDLAYGLGRMLLGLCKKLLIADSVAPFALRLLLPDQTSPLGLWLAMYAYAAQIYFDFSGYSDLAIGAARLLGYRVPENFDWPYLAADLPSFWRRWHISLSSWIRDYLYIPLGGNRGGRARVSLNLIAVMALCGLWHGPAWHFVVWGLWHGLGLALTRLVRGEQRASAAPPSRLRRGFATLATFHFVCLGWLWFATPDLSVALRCFARLLHLGS
jgi:alginate O-acetyltransferase complex protein AlgI